MGMGKWFKEKWNNMQGGQVVHDFGVVSSGSKGTREVYRLKGKLRFGKWGWNLHLELDKDPNDSDSTMDSVNIYFNDPVEAMQVFEHAQGLITSNQGPSGESIGPISTRILKLLGGEVVKHFGRIDNHPRGDSNNRVELALVRRKGEYDFFVMVGSRARFDWPVQLIDDMRFMTQACGQLMNQYMG